MGLKTVTIEFNSLKDSIRLEPRFYYNQKILEDYLNTYGYETIKDFATLASGRTPTNTPYKIKEIDIYFIKNANIKRFFLDFINLSFISVEEYNRQKRSRVIPGDILLSNTATAGFACIIPSYVKEANINQNSLRIRFYNKSSYFYGFSYFLVAFLNSKFSQIQILSLFTRNIQKFLNKNKFSEFKIPKIDKKIIYEWNQKIKNALEFDEKALNLIQQAQQLFYQKLGINFSKIKKENVYSVNLLDFRDADLWTPKYSYPLYVNTLKAIKQKWQTVSIGEIATIKKGDEVGSENYNSYLDKKDFDVPFIRTSDLVNYEVDQFPDFYIPKEIYEELNQDVKAGDVLFTKDGKIGMTAMITESDKVIIASGLSRLRLKNEAKKYNLTPEYLFLVLSLKETGSYPALRRTVTASTIPHLREERLKEIEIPILDKESVSEITKLVKEAFKLKDEKKKLIEEVRKEIDDYFKV